MSRKLVIGVDFGTLSGRAVVVDAATGEELGSAVHEYANAVIDERLPGSKKSLDHDSAYQDPQDYLDVLGRAVPKALKKAKALPEEVAGLGIDFTACTVLPCTAQGKPLCFLPAFRSNPHAWVKLWKHHAAQAEADEINALGARRGEEFVRAYGGRYSSEWFFSKLLETLHKAPKVYAAADRFIEACDWIVWQMTGIERRCQCTAGYKAMWVYPYGEGWAYPSPEFFRELDPQLENVVQEKLSTELFPLGSRAGGLTPSMAKAMGLRPGTPVAVGNVDAHVAVPACTVTEPGKLVMIMGTSICHMVLGRERQFPEGMCGVVKDGIIPGFFGFEAGQSAVGDIFSWFFENGATPSVKREARRRGLDIPDYLEKEASRLAVGESGLLALDWWNGNRSVLVNADLTGLLVGMNLSTKPHEIFRALIEGTAFGTRTIIESFVRQGVAVDEIYACGGLSVRRKHLMQIYADVTGRPIKVAESTQACALGSAMHGAVAAGIYPDIAAAAARMARVRKKAFLPDSRAHAAYGPLFAEYTRLHDHFGRGACDTMKRLKAIKAAACH